MRPLLLGKISHPTIRITGAPVRRASHNMATLSDTIKPNKTYLEAVLRTALLGKTEDEYVDFFLSGLRGDY